MTEKKRSITMAEVAERAGVSKATVSRALAGSSLIGYEVRAQVRAAAEELGYIRRHIKRHSERCILTIKLVLPPEGNRTSRLFYSFTDLVEGLRNGLSPSGVNLIVETGGPSYDPYPHKKGGEIEAFVFAFHRPTTATLDRIADEGAIAVVLNRVVRGVRQVINHHQHAMMLLAQHLKARGVTRNCCFVGYSGIDDVMKSRLQGFASACTELGIQFDPKNDLWMADSPENLSARGVKSWHEKGTQTFVGVNDVVASLLVQHAREIGFKVPTDLRITGCDNAPLRGVTVPMLTTVDLSMRRLAEEAGRSIHAEVVEGISREQSIQVKGDLLIGETT